MVVMKIADTRLLEEVQKEFSTQFPFLELAFHEKGQIQAINPNLMPGLKIGDIRTNGSNGLLVLYGNITCDAVEQTMADIFGLHVKICNRWNVPCNPSHRAKPLAELNYKAMHMVEDVVFV